MRKYLITALAAIMAASALCGCSKNAAPTDGADVQATAKADKGDKGSKDSGAAETAPDGEAPAGAGASDNAANLDPSFDGADELIDMDKVEGTDAAAADDSMADGEVAGAEITITDAKVIDYGGDVLIVSFEFKNKTGRDATFNGQVKASAQQDGVDIPPAVVTGVEGVSCETLAQVVGNGDKITVQKAFALSDTENPVTVRVMAANNPDPAELITKTFNLK